MGEVLGLRGMPTDQFLLTRIGVVTINAPLFTVQQVGQSLLVVHVGCRHHRAMGQSRAAIHADTEFHAELPLLAFAGLAHLRIPCILGVLRRTRRTDDCGIHNTNITASLPDSIFRSGFQ